ncbi:MAG: hypothetical protein NBV60_01820 [Erythrobacter sp.]|nr:hypothetical protein [Erythrobacter sp.]
MGLFDMHNQRQTGPSDWAAGLLFGPAPNGEDDEGGIGPEYRGTLIRFSIWIVIVPLVAWLLAYISGLFPYLGYYHYSRDGMAATYIPAGPRTMVLFEGQKAFIDYEVDSKKGFDGTVFIDIRPWPALDHTPEMHTISGKTSGRLEVTIPKTGLYRFYHGAGPMAYREDMSYSVTWGAK